MDDLLASHFARILVRDPLILCAEDLTQIDLTTSNLFEQFQGLTWQAVRFKPPPPKNVHDIGWRVEFRSMEVQPTDFENAAFSIFIILLTRAILAFNVDFYMPISLVEDNMETAHARDAVNCKEFHFPATWMTEDSHNADSHDPTDGSSTRSSASDHARPDPPPSITTLNGHGNHPEYPPTPISTLINGPPSSAPTASAPGLLPLIRRYLNSLPITLLTPAQRVNLEPYLELVARRADGLDVTPATRIREIVRRSGDYAMDSYVSEAAQWKVITEVGIGAGDCGTGLGEASQNGGIGMGCGEGGDHPVVQ